MDSLREKIEWMLSGHYLTDKGDEKMFAYSIDIDKKIFYAIDIKSTRAKNPEKRYFDQHLPMEDIDENMEILVLI